MENIRTGAIPVTGRITLDSTIDQWKMVQNGLVSEMDTSAIIIVDKIQNKKVRISIKLVKVNSPRDFVHETQHDRVEAIMSDTDQLGAILAIRQYFFDEMDGCTWFLIGYIKGKKNIPIIIFHYLTIDFAVYSIIKDEEQIKKLFPLGMGSGLN